MKSIDDAYSDLIARVDTSTRMTARAGRHVVTYQSQA
jgi:hypothetical protein